MSTDEIKKKHRKLPRPQVDPEDRLESQTAIKPADLAELGPDEFEKRHAGPDIEDLVSAYHPVVYITPDDIKLEDFHPRSG